MCLKICDILNIIKYNYLQFQVIRNLLILLYKLH